MFFLLFFHSPSPPSFLRGPRWQDFARGRRSFEGRRQLLPRFTLSSKRELRGAIGHHLSILHPAYLLYKDARTLLLFLLMARLAHLAWWSVPFYERLAAFQSTPIPRGISSQDHWVSHETRGPFSSNVPVPDLLSFCSFGRFASAHTADTSGIGLASCFSGHPAGYSRVLF